MASLLDLFCDCYWKSSSIESSAIEVISAKRKNLTYVDIVTTIDLDMI